MTSGSVSAKATVMIVDDEPAIRHLVAALLRQAGFVTFEAANGAEALTISSEIAGSLDVLVTDVVMPKMDGITLADRIVSAHPDTKVLFISGFYDAAAMPGKKRLPASAFLEKPFSAPALLTALETLTGTTEHQDSESHAEQPHRGPKILAIDDDAQFLRRLSSILRKASFDVLTASDGQEAVRILEDLHAEISLAIVDLVLPGQYSGFDVIGMLTRRPSRMKIIATSAIFRETQLYLAMRAGADAVIRKPVSGASLAEDEWLEAVRGLLSPPDVSANN